MDKLIQLCRKRIEDSLQWGSSAQWTSEDFEQLSDKIFERTQVRLSVTTLKRIWGKVKYDSSPNVVTLNALAKYMGYESWRNFRSRYAIIVSGEEMAGDKRRPQAPSKKRIAGEKRLLLIAPVLLVLLVVLSFLFIEKGEVSASQKKEAGVKKVVAKPLFESTKTSDDLPNSVVFHYDASMYDSDEVYIQQNWDPQRREKVDGKGNYHTSIYYTPGYFASKLIVDGEVKAEDIVFIKTHGWKAMINLSAKPAYLHASEIKGKGVMEITPGLFAEKSGSKIFNDTWATFHNVQEFEVTGDHFSFETSLRNGSAIEESVCRNVLVYILGTVSAVIVPLSDKGCISELRVLTGDRWVNGKESDLSAFGCDFKERQNLKIAVADKRLEVSLNQKTILSETVSRSIGDIIGIRFAFEGAGEVGNVKLAGPEGVVYEEEF